MADWLNEFNKRLLFLSQHMLLLAELQTRIKKDTAALPQEESSVYYLDRVEEATLSAEAVYRRA